MKIYWLKQKALGLLLVVLSLIFAEFMIMNEAGLMVIAGIAAGVFLFVVKDRLFRQDYIYVIGNGRRRL